MDAPKNNREIIEYFIEEVFNKHDFSMLEKYMRDDYIQHNKGVGQGKSGFLEFFEQTFKSIPDWGYVVHKVVAEGDMVMAFCNSVGTHTHGEWLGKEPTGNKLDYKVVDIFRIQDGQIAEHWDVADTMAMARQLGTIERFLAGPPPENK